MREKFQDVRFTRTVLARIAQANQIIDEYRGKGYSLTLRQLYYQFVARGLLDNKHQEYKRLGATINDARMAGLIDWDAIEDRTRNLAAWAKYGSPGSFMEVQASRYAEDWWRGQESYVEVWVEKEALVGVIERACAEFRVPYFACRGYTSQSEMYVAGKRLGRMKEGGKNVIILHFGDHDPSGIDMSRDNQDRIDIFCRHYGVHLKRLALNMDQIEEQKPPPNPVKFTDSRAEGYQEQFGDESWELDALDPEYIGGLVRENVLAVLDKNLFRQAQDRGVQGRRDLQLAAQNWARVQKFLEQPPPPRYEPS